MNRILELRQKNNWTQTQLAVMLQTTQQSIARYENEERGLSIQNINALCDLFGCTADYLLCRTDIPTNEISQEEASVLDEYRRLSPAGREYIQQTLVMALTSYEGKNNTAPDLEAVE